MNPLNKLCGGKFPLAGRRLCLVATNTKNLNLRLNPHFLPTKRFLTLVSPKSKHHEKTRIRSAYYGY